MVGLSSKPLYPLSDPCLPHALVPATFETRIYFSKFIDSLEKQDSKLYFPTQTEHFMFTGKIAFCKSVKLRRKCVSLGKAKGLYSLVVLVAVNRKWFR